MNEASMSAIETFGPVFEDHNEAEPFVNGSGSHGWGSVAQISKTNKDKDTVGPDGVG